MFVSELGTTATFTVVLDTAPEADVSLSLNVPDTTEGTAAPTNLTFTSSNWSVPQTVTVTGVDDAIIDGNIVFSIDFAAATSTDTDYNGITPPAISALNIDNDALVGTANILVNPTGGLVTSEAPTTASFSVLMQAAPVADVKNCLDVDLPAEVAIVAGGGVVADATCPGGFSITYTSANWSTARTVTVTGVDDGLQDGPQPFTVSFAADTVTLDPNYNSLTPSSVTGTNNDNDTVGITTTVPVSTSETGTTSTFTVVLDSEPTGSVTVSPSSTNALEGLVKTLAGDAFAATAITPLTFTAGACPATGNWCTPQTVTIRGQNDTPASVDGNITYDINLTPGGADANYSGLGVQTVSMTNNDDDAAGVTVVGGPLNVTEAGLGTSYTVVLNTQPTALVKVCLSMSDTTEANFVIAGNVLAGDADCPQARLEFTTLNWSTVQTVNVAPIDDNIKDGAQAFSVGMATVTADAPYNAITIASLSGSTADNEGAVSYIVSSPGGLLTTESGHQDYFTIRLSTEPTALVKVCVALAAGSAGEVQLVSGAGHLLGIDGDCSTGGRLEFSPTNWSSAQHVYVQGLDDFTSDGNTAFTVNLTKVTTDVSYAGAALANQTGTNYESITALPYSAAATADTDSPTDVCASTSIQDDIVSMTITQISPTQIHVNVFFNPTSFGIYTETDGVHLKLFMNNTAAGTFTEFASWVMLPGTDFTLDTLNSRSIVYTLPPLPTGTHYIRAALIDRGGPTDTMTGTCATGSSGTLGVSDRGNDNLDVGIIVP